MPTTPPDGRRSPLRTASVPALALLPLRMFAGATFLYAGFDKLLDPRFFDPASPASIQAQMIAFARLSPIGGIVRLGEPVAVPIGFLIAIAEIAIGLGGLSGLAFRVAAVGGAILSILFWLTASWATHPYYVGADLPYAFGWIALALAGHGGLLVPDRFLAIGSSSRGAREGRPDAGRAARGEVPLSAGRRTILQTGILAIVALTAASLAVPLRLAGVERAEDTGAADASERPARTPAASEAGSEPPPTAITSTGTTSGIRIAKVADVDRKGSAAFTIPFDAPVPLPAGDPGVIVRLADGTYVAFDAVCTHAGCTVEWDAADRLLFCPCHGAAFDPAHHAAVVDGPTNEPLAELSIVVDHSSGTVLLQG